VCNLPLFKLKSLGTGDISVSCHKWVPEDFRKCTSTREKRESTVEQENSTVTNGFYALIIFKIFPDSAVSRTRFCSDTYGGVCEFEAITFWSSKKMRCNIVGPLKFETAYIVTCCDQLDCELFERIPRTEKFMCWKINFTGRKNESRPIRYVTSIDYRCDDEKNTLELGWHLSIIA
jgi:hypothetical protein